MLDQLTQSLQALGEKALRLKDEIQTEEATKSALVQPFIMALGYDIFDPTEVKPEYVADIGIKKGEKIDYAIMREGKSIMIIECKHWKEKLEPHQSQLFRYFHTLHARFAVLTNGIVFKFYTDLNESNKMDETPFLEINITALREVYLKEILKFHKNAFDENAILTTATELRYTTQLRKSLHDTVFNPNEDFIRFLLKNEYEGKITQKVVESFEPIVRKAIDQSLSDLVSNRLKAALVSEYKAQSVEGSANSVESEDSAAEAASSGEAGSEEKEKGIVTTFQELESFTVIKGVLRGVIDIKRVNYRDNKGFFSIVIDGTNRKTICKLFMDASPYRMDIAGDDKSVSKYNFDSVDDLYKFEAELVASAKRFV